MMAPTPSAIVPPLHPVAVEGRGEDLVGDLAEDDRAAHRHHGEEGGADERDEEGSGLQARGRVEQAGPAPHDPLVGALPRPPRRGT